MMQPRSSLMQRLLHSINDSSQYTYDSLLSAVRQGRLETVRLLINELINTFGLSYFEQWADGYVLLCLALENNHAAVAKLLLRSGSKVNSQNENPSDTPLHFAARNGDIEIVEMLLEKNAKIDAKNVYGSTPLHNAIINKKLEVTELLLKHRADVNAREDGGVSPLHVAVEKGCSQIVDHLLKHGANVNCQCYSTLVTRLEINHFPVSHFTFKNSSLLFHGETRETVNPLHIAAKKGYTLIAENLLNHGVCINSLTLNEGYTPLHLAAFELGNEEVVKLFLKKGADINVRTKNDNLTPLHIATKNGHETIVKLLLQHGAKVDNQNKCGQTILDIAVKRGNLMIVEDVLKYYPDSNNQSNRDSLKIAIYKGYHENHKKMVEALLEYGITIRPEDANNPKLLHKAVKHGHLKIVESLLKYGADTNVHDKIGNTTIFYAIENADLKMTKLLLTNGAKVKDNPELLNIAVDRLCIEIVEALLQHDVDVNCSDKWGRTALHLTARAPYGFKESSNEDSGFIRGKIAKLLLSKGANVDSQSEDGVLTLHAAIQHGYVKVVEVLLEYNANVNSLGRDGFTPLHSSAYNGNEEIITLLLNKEANVNIKTDNGNTALHIATQMRHVRVIKAFLEMQHDVDINAINKYGLTALHFTALRENKDYFFELNPKDEDEYYGYKLVVTDKDETGEDIKIKLTIAKLLLSKGANINCRARNDITPLHISALKRNEQFITLLLNNGANVNSKQKNGITALHFATMKGHKVNVKVLLKNGARVDSKSKRDVTPLHLAAERGYQEIIDILVKFGADINSKNKDGKTALHIASRKRHVSVVVKLLEYGSDINITSRINQTPLDSVMLLINDADCCDLDDCFQDEGYYGVYGYFNHDEHVRILEEIANVLRCHIVKMKTASLFVSEKNLLSINGRDELRPFQHECEEEIARIKIEKINDANIYFYDILTKGTGSLAAYMRNENIVKVLKSDYKTIFPIYASMINSNFNKGLKRKEVLEKCNEVVHFSFDNFHLPPICTEHIFSYLNEEELRNLMDAFKSPASASISSSFKEE